MQRMTWSGGSLSRYLTSRWTGRMSVPTSSGRTSPDSQASPSAEWSSPFLMSRRRRTIRRAYSLGWHRPGRVICETIPTLFFGAYGPSLVVSEEGDCNPRRGEPLRVLTVTHLALGFILVHWR